MIILDGKHLNLDSLVRIARGHEKVSINTENTLLVLAAERYVEKVAAGDKPVYGINTGFGKLSDVRINPTEVGKLQQNLLMSHACGVGNPLAEDIVRGMMAMRVNALIKGYSGIRLTTIEKLIELLNKDICPVVFEKGSLGSSGDLAPLSHMSLPLIGLGEVFYQGKRMSTKSAFALAGISPLKELKAKEGLSLINGTQAMTAIGALTLYDAIHLEKTATLALSLSLEALHGIVDAFDPRVHELRGQSGQIEVAQMILKHISKSKMTTKQGEMRVQDAYSLRCAPQVHGASLDTFKYVKKIVEAEMNAVTDNPIVFYDQEEAISAGNFHGQPLALAFDFLGIAISELANISERRIERLVNPSLSNGLPPFLVNNCGINSGFMIIQYSAASLVSENKVLSHPASVDSIPSSANQEDHVSMGTIAARKAGAILDNARKVIAMEYMSACQAIDLRAKKELGNDTQIAYNTFRKHIPFLEEDTIMYPHINAAEALLIDDTIYNAINWGDIE
ncbi:MAG: histidine ammonia-lyase [Candidatus Izemoplasmatales bacterium]|jgi:histidine ammonia-lyase|nr:histidine ammonia-lyase [Candidatus Izemoplasmatales bacterium]